MTTEVQQNSGDRRRGGQTFYTVAACVSEGQVSRLQAAQVCTHQAPQEGHAHPGRASKHGAGSTSTLVV